MKTLHSTLAILILIFSLNMVSFAQDETAEPTAEVPAEATVIVEAPVVEPATDTIELVQQFDFNQLLNLVLVAIILVQSVMIHRSIPLTKWQEFVKTGLEVATHTESELDDKAFAFAKHITPYLQKLGVFTNPDVPVKPSPGATTVTTTTSIDTADSAPVG